MFKKIIVLFIFTAGFLFSENLRISQIDTGKLLLEQNVMLYLSVTGNNGGSIGNLKKEQFNIFESPDGKKFKKIDDIVSFNEKANYKEGINFLLLIDNSVSMYENIRGRKTDKESEMKMNYVRQAVLSLLENINFSKDRVGIAVYNSNYKELSSPVSDKDAIAKNLSEITLPVGDEGWTEIYSSVSLAINDFSQIKGRKAIIVLSDGENMPYYKNTGKEHKIFKKKIFRYDEPVALGQKEGISVFAVNFGKPEDAKDAGLSKIANETGGVVFNAYNEEELRNIYKNIQELILNEYQMVYKGSMTPSEKKFVKVVLDKDSKKSETVRYYFSSALFGEPLKEIGFLLFIPFLIAVFLIWLLSQLKFKKENDNALLEVLYTQVGTKALTKNITLTKGKTIIGGSANADLTIVGSNASTRNDNYATILYDDAKDKYTIMSSGGDVTVNNKPVKNRTLEAGDVINTGAATIVFDEKTFKKGKKK